MNTKDIIYLAAAIAGIAGAYFTIKSIKDGAGETANAVNPFNHDNIFSTAVNDYGASITGNEGWSLGGAVYDFFNPTPDAAAKVLADPSLSVDSYNWLQGADVNSNEWYGL